MRVHAKLLSRTNVAVCSGVMLWLAMALPPASAQHSAKGKDLLADLVARAQREGELNAALVSSAAKTAPRVVAAFKKRFGLNIDVNLDVTGGESGKFSKLQAALKLGAPPTFDTLQGGDDNSIEMIEAGFSMRVDNWQELLAQINPLVQSGAVKPEEISPGFFSGYSFMWGNRTKSLLYNPRKLSKSQIPRSRADIANPKYKGMYAVPPWTSAWQYGVLFYDKAKWLKILDQVGMNACCVLRFDASTDRILLGDLAFASSNTYYLWQVKAKDPEAPMAQSWFTDYTAMTQLFYMIPKGSKHPAAATLFALWMTTPEAEQIWQPVAFHPNVVFGTSELDQQARRSLKESGSKLVTWFDNAETRKALQWFGTKEGRAYRTKITKALTQRK